MPEAVPMLESLDAARAFLREARKALAESTHPRQLIEIDILLSVAETEIRRLCASVSHGDPSSE